MKTKGVDKYGDNWDWRADLGRWVRYEPPKIELTDTEARMQYGLKESETEAYIQGENGGAE